MGTIISFDGGGALGVGPTTFAACADKLGMMPKPDYVCGTSVGGLLALLVASGYSWAAIDSIANEAVGQIFNPKYRCLPIRGPKWDHTGLLGIAKKYLGKRCHDSLVPFSIPSMDMTTGRPRVWTEQDDVPMWYVALATSAAPTYFAIWDGRFVDGGLVANNPSMIGLTRAVQLGVSCLPDTKLLSFDTGGAYWNNPGLTDQSYIWQEVLPVIHGQILAGEFMAEQLATQWLGTGHVRVAPVGADKDFAMDDLDSLEEWRGLWRAAFDTMRSDAGFKGLTAGST